MDLRKMMQVYQEDGLAVDLASARVCQDIVLMAIANGPLNRNVTIKGGVVMRSITNNNRRATRDIDLRRVSGSRQRWIDEDIEVIADGIIDWIKNI